MNFTFYTFLRISLITLSLLLIAPSNGKTQSEDKPDSLKDYKSINANYSDSLAILRAKFPPAEEIERMHKKKQSHRILNKDFARIAYFLGYGTRFIDADPINESFSKEEADFHFSSGQKQSSSHNVFELEFRLNFGKKVALNSSYSGKSNSMRKFELGWLYYLRASKRTDFPVGVALVFQKLEISREYSANAATGNVKKITLNSGTVPGMGLSAGIDLHPNRDREVVGVAFKLQYIIAPEAKWQSELSQQINKFSMNGLLFTGGLLFSY